MKVITLLLGLATSLRDLYKNIMTSVLSFVFNKLKLQGGSEEDKKTIKDRLRKFKDDAKGKFKSVGEKFVNLGEKTRTIVLNYIDRHAADFIAFYKRMIWPSVRKFVDDVSKKCDVTILVEGLKGLNVNTFLPYFHYFITEIVFGINILFDPDTLLNTPEEYTSINKLMNVKSGGGLFDNITLEYLRKPITENNYGFRLERYLKNIVLHEFVKELELENVNTVEEYQEYVKNLLKEQKTQAAEQQFEQDCVEAVLKNSYAEFPQSLINQAVERNVQRIEEQAKQYQLPVEVLLQYYQMGSLEDFRKVSEEQVRKEFLQELVFEEIIKLENIEASQEELEAKYLELAGGDQAKVKQVKKQYRESQVSFHIKTLKAVELVKANAVTK